MKASIIIVLVMILTCPVFASKLGNEAWKKVEKKNTELHGKKVDEAEGSMTLTAFAEKKCSFPNQDVKLRFNARGDIKQPRQGIYLVNLYDKDGGSFKFEFGEDGFAYIKSIPVGTLWWVTEKNSYTLELQTSDDKTKDYFVYVYVQRNQVKRSGKVIKETWTYHLVGREIAPKMRINQPKYMW